MSCQLSREELDNAIASGLSAHDGAVRAWWDQIRIEPELWQCSPWGDADGGFWVVAIEDNRALWFNHIEDGFNWSSFSTRGTLDDYGCNQTELVGILEGFAQQISEHARARVTEGGVPPDVSGPGAIVRRQTTYWEVRAAAGAHYRIHVRDKAEVAFADVAYATVEIADRHPVLVQYVEPIRTLYVAGTPLNPRALAGRVDRAIRDATGSWRGLSDYGGVDAAAKLLAGRHGLLVEAPDALCVVAAGVLEAEGVRCSIVGAAPARPGHRALLLGRSFVIAKGFAFERLERRDA